MNYQYCITIAELDGTELRYNPFIRYVMLYDMLADSRVYLSRDEVKMFFDPQPKYVIINTRLLPGETVHEDTLFWSNELGWIEPTGDVSVFSNTERNTLQLPVGGYWYSIFG